MGSQLVRILDRLPKCRVLVLGDFLLDEFVFGQISRVSREAPVLILSYRETERTPGGGANTLANLWALGAEGLPLGFLGSDEAGDHLLAGWPPGIDCSGIERPPGWQTTRKTRILAGSPYSFRQQVIRIDRENPFPVTESQEGALIRRMGELAPSAHAVIVSDYSLGTVTPRLREAAHKLARQYQIPIVADSRFQPAEYAGFTALTPNISELESTLDQDLQSSPKELLRIGQDIRRSWNLEALLVTQGKRGMVLFDDDGVCEIPAFGSDEVSDVTGAGDTVIATFTSALGAGFGFRDSAQLANCAAGLVVMKRGTAQVSATEIRQALLRQQGDR